jgi:hypothetical protein
MEASISPIYPRQRLFGLFLCMVSLALFLPAAFPFQGQPNGALFGVCYAAAFVGVMINPVVRSRVALLPSTPRQRRFSNLGLLILAVGAALASVLFADDPRTLWLGLFAIVGIHFLLFGPVHGRIAGILGALLISNAAAGFLLPAVALPDFFIVDGSLKLLAGALYLKLAPLNW